MKKGQTVQTQPDHTEAELGWLTPRDKDDALRLHSLVNVLNLAREYLGETLDSLDALETILKAADEDVFHNVTGIVIFIQDLLREKVNGLDQRLEQILPPDADTNLFKEVSRMLKAEEVTNES